MAAVPVFETRFAKLPESMLYWILYPVGGGPPLLVGGFHERFIWVPEDDMAVKPVGGLGGMFLGGTDVFVGVAGCSDEVLLVPIAFIADTLYM